jgi:hypothetical protein
VHTRGGKAIDDIANRLMVKHAMHG